jgi:ATP-dependent DNA helicase DinG
MNVEKAFAADGPLAAAIPGFNPRPQQIEMAEHIAATLKDNGVLVAEAGTGTGKTYAYLVPALLGGGKVIISTGTKTLQDQLFNRDLPTIRAALKVPVGVALLKGRANYVCHYHLARNLVDGRFTTPEDSAHLRAIGRFMEISQSGDKAECPEVPEDAAAWMFATSSRDNCLGQECPNIKECFVAAARRAAMDADVVVVNHHLFFADVMLRDEGMGELLPSCNAVIFDEAHQLPETASLFFGESVSTSQLLELARDTRSETVAAARDCLDLIEATRKLEKSARDLRLTVNAENARFGFAQLEDNKPFHEAVEALDAELAGFCAMLETQAERSEGLANCLRRTQELQEILGRWQKPEGTDWVRWVEVFSQSLALHATPLSIASIFKRQMDGHPRAWVFTSATLAVGRDFGHYCRELGLHWVEPPIDTAVWGSPFDYPQAGRAVRPPEHARAQQPGVSGCGGGGGLPVDPGRPGPRLRAVHFPAGHAAHPRSHRREAGAGEAQAAPAHPGGGLAHRAARSLPAPGQCHPGGQPELLGRGGCARRRPVGGGHRQAALRPARRSRACGPHRAHAEIRPQPLHGVSAPARRHQRQTGRRPAHPHRAGQGRPRHLRPTHAHQALRQARLAEPAAHAPQQGGGGSGGLS